MGLSFVRDCNLFSFSSLNCSAIRRDNCLGVRKWPYFLSMQYFGFAEVLIRHCSDIANVTYNLIPFTLRWHFVTESLTLQILNQLFFKFLTMLPKSSWFFVQTESRQQAALYCNTSEIPDTGSSSHKLVSLPLLLQTHVFKYYFLYVQIKSEPDIYCP